MSNEDLWPISGFTASDHYEGGTRSVSINGVDGVLTVTLRSAHGDFTLKHYRLVEVEQRWVNVDE